MRLRQLFEAPSKVAVAAFGRMNPPTIGHKKLTDAMMTMPGDHFVFVSHTQDKKKNPLSFEQKVRFAKASFGSHVTVGNEGVRTIIQMMQKLESLGYTDIVYIAGSDRVEQFEKLLNDYNGKDYTFNSIKIVNAGQRDPDADGAEGMSASKMRAAALEDKFDLFKQGVANQSIAQDMFDSIRDALGVTEQESQQMNDAAAAINAYGEMKREQQTKEGELVLNKASLVPHIKNVIMDYLDQEDDVEKLSRILKMMVGKEVHAHGNRYRIESTDITEAFNDIQTEVAGPKKCWPKFKKAGTQAGTGKNKGKRVNKCVPK